MKRWFWGCLLWVSCAVFDNASSVARADLVIFNLGGALNGSSMDEAASGALTVDGLTATLTANDGLLNATTSTFGINAAGSGDATALLDAGSGIHEFITITFDQAVTFNQLTLSAFSGSERATLVVGLNPAIFLSATSAGSDVFGFLESDLPQGNLLAPGQSVLIGYAVGSAADNGFSLDGFQVNTVPEPTCLSCLASVLLTCLLRRKRIIRTVLAGATHE